MAAIITAADRDSPCEPDRRVMPRPGSEESKRLLPVILRIFSATAEAGKDLPVGEKFTYEIPQELIPRKHLGLLAMCLAEGGYESGLIPTEIEIREHNGKRRGWLTVRKHS